MTAQSKTTDQPAAFWYRVADNETILTCDGEDVPANVPVTQPAGMFAARLHGAATAGVNAGHADGVRDTAQVTLAAISAAHMVGLAADRSVEVRKIQRDSKGLIDNIINISPKLSGRKP